MNRSFLFSGLLAVTPLAVSLLGCGGGTSPQATTTPTPFPTTTPTPAATSAATFDLTSSPDVFGGNLSGSQFSLFSGYFSVFATYRTANRLVIFSLPSITARGGAVRTFGASDTDSTLFSETPGQSANYIAHSGTLTVTVFSTAAATLTFKDVVYTNSNGTNITINGTISGPYTR